MRRIFIWSGGAGAFQNRGNGTGKNFDVEPEGPFIEILEVELHPLIKANGVSAADLPQAGDPGARTETTALPILVEALIIADGKRARTDKAHIAFEDVPELWEFVNAGATEKLSERGDAWIVFDFEDRAGHFVEAFELVDQCFGTRNHGAELVDQETALIETDALLKEEDRAAGSEFNEKSDNGEERRERDEKGQGDEAIKGTLDHLRPAVERAGIHLDVMIAAEGFGARRRVLEAENIRIEAHDDAVLFAHGGNFCGIGVAGTQWKIDGDLIHNVVSKK